VSVDRAVLHKPIGKKQLLSLANFIASENCLALVAHHRARNRGMVLVNAIGEIAENREAEKEGQYHHLQPNRRNHHFSALANVHITICSRLELHAASKPDIQNRRGTVQQKPTTRPSRSAVLPSASRFDVPNTAECYVNSAGESSSAKFADATFHSSKRRQALYCRCDQQGRGTETIAHSGLAVPKERVKHLRSIFAPS
jgi:hypothetical protein